MKKIHLIESIQSFLASDNVGDSKVMFHPEEIKIHLNNVFNKAVYDSWLNGKRYSDFSQLDAWSKTYVVNVLNQCGTRAYCLLPFAPVHLPDMMGIRQVKSHYECSVYYGGVIGAQWLFAPIEATANVIFDELEVSTMDDYPTYRLEQSNVNAGAGEPSHMLWLEKLPVAPDELVTSVDILLITPLDAVDDYDDVALPAGMENDIIQQVISLMSKKPIPDVSNDMVIKPSNQ
jgi:hypothetical protein